MKVIVLGGGVVGVCTAYYLCRDGHEVTVVERAEGVAKETSFANAGIVAPGHAFAWASPRAPLVLVQSLWSEHTAFRMRFKIDPRMWAWSLHFLRNCTAARARANTLSKLRICIYSRDCLKALREEEGLHYDALAKGALYLYRDPKLLETGIAHMRLLQDNGLVAEGVDPDRVAEIEPALAPVKHKLAGAVYSPHDESGDSHLLSQALQKRCEEMGATFMFETNVKGLRSEGDRITACVTDRGDLTADQYVLSLGSYSPLAMRGLGIRMPIYPVKGYSLTVPTGPERMAPTVPLVDEHYLVAFGRMGNRLRLTATAEFAGYDTDFKPADFKPMLDLVRDLFPDGGDYDNPMYWACLRPMTPDGPPVIGYARHKNLLYNTGHGHIGWTMAAGSGRVGADLIAGRKPEIDLSGMEPDRF